MNINEALMGLVYTIRSNMIAEIRKIEPDLSPMHMKSLKVIANTQDCTGQKLVGFMLRDKAQINRLVKELVNQDLVVKLDNVNDKRSQILQLTPQGRALVSKFSQTDEEMFKAMIAGLQPQELAAFTKTIEHMQHNLGKHQNVLFTSESKCQQTSSN